MLNNNNDEDGDDDDNNNNWRFDQSFGVYCEDRLFELKLLY